jgi:hypothetical protein
LVLINRITNLIIPFVKIFRTSFFYFQKQQKNNCLSNITLKLCAQIVYHTNLATKSSHFSIVLTIVFGFIWTHTYQNLIDAKIESILRTVFKQSRLKKENKSYGASHPTKNFKFVFKKLKQPREVFQN